MSRKANRGGMFGVSQPVIGRSSTGFPFASGTTATPQAAIPVVEPKSEPEITTSVFDNPSSTTDITLEVEGRQLHVNKGVLVAASSVFEKMFEGDFKEKNEIPLNNKTYAEIVEMLLRIYPSELKSITPSKVDKLLQLADEYKMTALTQKCERFLLYQCTRMTSDGSISSKVLVHYIYLADKYHLDDLLTRATDITSHLVFGERNDGISYEPSPDRSAILSHEEYPLISEPIQLLLALKRISFLERN
ncbi:BTB and MATH domain-containing protein 36-like [Haliotis rubra]|uniref:BTB and MATH domain-containing protein 36-like n=1 Tax=Haliotis rubra TaxID=36100 RepID=UPI001EE62142|nr:BTB and MATH domain-containing protein 36-like [Haliotis rubra]